MNPLDQVSFLEAASMDFKDALKSCNLYPVKAGKPEILQLNVTRACNLSCRHCHVCASPYREEVMSPEIMEKCIRVIKDNRIAVVDITGGAPELNPYLEDFLKELSSPDIRVIVRSNLVILKDSPYNRFLNIYPECGVEICASLPDFRQAGTDRQRGNGVFKSVITILQKLNEKSYASPDSELTLNLVYNPGGAYPSGSQESIESEFRKRLQNEYNITFNNLFCINNMPVGRFLNALVQKDMLQEYLEDLQAVFNPCAVPGLMCRNTISVGFDGTLYDCDFNQMLNLKIKETDHIDKFDMEALGKREIVLHNHCYGCTAGSGSSCQGETA